MLHLKGSRPRHEFGSNGKTTRRERGRAMRGQTAAVETLKCLVRGQSHSWGMAGRQQVASLCRHAEMDMTDVTWEYQTTLEARHGSVWTEQRRTGTAVKKAVGRAKVRGRDEIYLQMGRKLEDLPLPNRLGDSTHARVRRRPTGAELWCWDEFQRPAGAA